MIGKETLAEEAKEAGGAIVHLVSVILGLLLLVVALAMGVTMVLLPASVAVALAGFLFIVWGIYQKPQT